MKYIPVRSTEAEAALTDAVENAEKTIDQAVKVLTDDYWWGPFVPPPPFRNVASVTGRHLARHCKAREQSLKNIAHQASFGAEAVKFYIDAFHQETISAANEIVAAETMQKSVTEARERLQAQVEGVFEPRRHHGKFTPLQLVNLTAAIEILRSVRKIELAINELIGQLPELVKDKPTVMAALERHAYPGIAGAFKDGKFVLDEPETPKN